MTAAWTLRLLIQVGIILVDARHSHTYRTTTKTGTIIESIPSKLFQGGYEDFTRPPRFSAASTPGQAPLRRSPREDLLHYWQKDKPKTFDDGDPTLLALSYYSLKMVAAEWVNYIHIINHSVKEYEFRNKDPSKLPRDVEKLNDNFFDLQVWRRRFLSSRQKLQSILHAVKSQEPADQTKCHDFKILKEDFEHVISSFQEYSVLMENMLTVSTSFAGLIDARRSLAETAYITRLTVLALTFVPLSFLSSIFGTGIAAIYGPGPKLFWVYFVVAVPLTGLVFLVAIPPKSLREWLAKRFPGRRGDA